MLASGNQYSCDTRRIAATKKMTLLDNLFLVTLCTLYFAASSLAIYDPRATTKKPPTRHESVLPWYLNEDDSKPPDDPSRSAKWPPDSDIPTTRRPRIISADTAAWSPWKKTPGSELEQRTEINEGLPGEGNFNRGSDPRYIEFDRQGNAGSPSMTRNHEKDDDSQRHQDRSGGLFEQSQHIFRDDQQYAGYNEQQEYNPGWKNPVPPQISRDGGKTDSTSQTELDKDQDLYEGISNDTTKPHKEKLLLSGKPKSTIARYDPRLGVQCPDHEATGQFVYPPDCKFFVNCWKGRAFVQPCAPGTFFNPETLECDFPHKVNCYGGEIAEFPSSANLDSTGRREPLLFGAQVQAGSAKLQEPRCPPHVTGLLPHPWDCLKFLQCANGGTFIMDCSPGTVFNPAISVCDWPYNVAGCEDALKTDDTDTRNPLTPPNLNIYTHPHHQHSRSEYREPRVEKKIACPAHYTGMLPHPETCKKFLQCTNGGTFVMDCAPGTAFNPETTACDWPHKVPSCSGDKSGLKQNSQNTATSGTWSPSRGTGSSVPWQDTQRYNQTHGHIGQGSWHGYNNRPGDTTVTTRPTGNQNYNGQLGQYDQVGHGTVQHNYHAHQGGTQSPGQPNWNQPGQNSGYGQHTNYQFADKNRSLWPHGPPSVGQGYPHENRQFDAHGNNGYQQHGDHHRYRPSVGPHSGNHPIPYDCSGPSCVYPYHHGLPPNTRHNPVPDTGNWQQQNYGNHRVPQTRPWSHSNYPYPQGTAESSQQETRAPYGQPPGSLPGRFDNNQWNRPHPSQDQNRVRFEQTDGYPPENRRTGQNFVPNRQDYGRTNPDFSHPHGDHIFPSSPYGLNETGNAPQWNPFLRNRTTTTSWPDRTTTWNKWSQPEVPEPRPGVFRPSTWTGQPDQGQPSIEPQGRPWSQGPISRDDKQHEWQSGTNVYQQSTVDRESETKMDQLPSKTNIFLQSKGKVRPETKIESQTPPQSLYPSGIYVIVNGTRGHYITKEVEVNQGHSKTRTYNRNNLESPGAENKTYDAIYVHLGPPVNHPFLSNSSSNRPGVDVHKPFTSDQTTTERNPDRIMRIPTRKNIPQTTTQEATDKSDVDFSSNTPTVLIEGGSDLIDKKKKKKNFVTKNETEFPQVVEPDEDNYAVDILEDKEVWKPRLVFANKTKPPQDNSVIMKIDKKTTDVDIFNVEAAPLRQDEEPFPVYYIPPVQPLSQAQKSGPPTPVSGQIIRLRGGSGPNDGYLEVQGAQPGWGIICDSRNSWTLKEAHIVCRQLGYTRGAEMAWQGRNTRNSVPTWIAANSVTCSGNETRFQSCKFIHNKECRVERDAVGVRCLLNRVAYCRKDEVPHEGQCYHLAAPETGLNHAEALEYCVKRDARLIDITNQAENNFVSEWLLQMHPEVESIMTGGVGFNTLNMTLWLWEDSSRAKFRFTKWWPGWLEDKKHPPWVGSRPACIVMKRKFPCHNQPDSNCPTDYFFWDAEDCATSTKGHYYVCERPYNDIGCVYGKGNQYTGTANVTSSGKECLPWADEMVAHPLLVNVVDRDVREKLKTHNYCRNPNPNKESRPWCFTGSRGEREYCDIPSCGKVGAKKSLMTGQCKPKHFECLPGECIPSPWVCDGEEDCTNGADERTCSTHLNLFEKSARHKLEGYEVEKWLNTPLKTCALRCKDADFTCRSFNHKSDDNVCLLSDSNVGMTGALVPNKEFDYYEMSERSMKCDGMFVCENKKCINQTQVCNGKNDCRDRSDESLCTNENLDYHIRLAGSNNTYEGRVEVKVLGHWGQVCDDGFGIINAGVICKELGFALGALEVRPGGFYGNMDPPTRFMVDQLKCRGNETSLRECDFEGWGVHNCQPEEAVGVVCKTAVDSCQDGHWKCDNSPACIPTPFICDEVVDCPDASDESPEHCNAQFELRLVNGSSPLQGRVEVRHHGVWGTVCDDDFSNATASVICRSLGYGGVAIAKKNGFFGPGEGPIWLDEVFCHGNESQLNRCEHNHWGQHNCDHNEDAGVICTQGDVNEAEFDWEAVSSVPEVDINDLLPTDCGRRSKDFNDDEDLIFAKVVHGSIAPKGTYPWQASIRVRGHSRSSHWCGAVILSPLHVLTAAHCLEGYNKGTYFVRAGDYNTEIDEGTEVDANIEDYYVHEKFRQGHRMNNDIALVLLKGYGIPLGKDIMPICLPSENTEYLPGLNCTISGFGSIETGKSTQSRDLRYGWIPLLDQSICRAEYVYGESAISDGMVCAGHLDEGVDSCDGDSGGPLACYHNGAFTLYGITSWGQHCGKANKPGVYVRVAHYRSWIDQKIKESLVGR